MHIFALLFVLSGCSSAPTTGTSCPAGFQDAGDGSCQPVAAPPVATDGQGGGSSPTGGGTGTGGGGGSDDIILVCIAYVEALDACLLEAFDTTFGKTPGESCEVFEDATGTNTSGNIDALNCYLAVLDDADCSSVEGYDAMVQRLMVDCPPLVIDTPYDTSTYYDDYGDSGW